MVPLKKFFAYTNLFLITLLTVMGCKPRTEIKENVKDTIKIMSTIAKSVFGKLPDGKEVFQYTVTNKNGIEMKVITYGGIITSLKTPDKNGIVEDIVLGFDSLAGYLHDPPFFGAIIGRYGNRIANGKFMLNGTEYTLAINNEPNNLHGGVKGFDKVLWHAEEIQLPEGPALKFMYVSKDMEEGFPGSVSVEVTYLLTDKNELTFTYEAITDKTTVINLTQHSYFNLTGNTKRDILDHEVMINSDEIVPINQTFIPTGKLKKVSGTPFDFTTPQTIGKRINDKDDQLELGRGYDHCFVLRKSNGSSKHAATVTEPVSGRTMEVYTTEPGVQLYSGNFLKGDLTGKDKVVYHKRFGLCLETEHFPDSPNQPQFPSVVLNPGDVYRTTTIYKFGVSKK